MELEKVLEKYSIEENSQASAPTEAINIEECLQNINMAIQFFKLDVLTHELQKASEAMDSLGFAMKIVNPIITEMRKLKGVGHFPLEKREQVYLLLKSYLTKKMFSISKANNLKKKIIVASAPGQLNELGSMVVAILCQNKKYEVEYLGGNVNAKVLGKLSQHFNPDAIFVGLNYSHDVVMSLADKNDYLRDLAIDLDDKTKVLIGAFDYCFQLPQSNMECFNDFENLSSFLSHHV